MSDLTGHLIALLLVWATWALVHNALRVAASLIEWVLGVNDVS